MSSRESIARQLKFRSLYNYGREIMKVPGLSVDIQTYEPFSAKVLVENQTLLLEYAATQGWNGSADQIREYVESWSIDLEALEAPYRDGYRPTLLPYLPAYEKATAYIESIRVIVVADNSFIAQARREGIIALHAGLLLRMNDFLDLIIVFMCLGALESFHREKERVFHTLLMMLRGTVRGHGVEPRVLGMWESLMDEVGARISWNSDEWISFKKSLWARVALFVLAHEYGHLVCGHHKGLFLSFEGAKNFPPRFVQELDADRYASEAIANFMLKAGGHPAEFRMINSPGWQIALALYHLVLAKEDAIRALAFETATERLGPSDYPESITRLFTTLEFFYPEMDFSLDPILGPMIQGTMAFHEFAADHPPLQV